MGMSFLTILSSQKLDRNLRLLSQHHDESISRKNEYMPVKTCEKNNDGIYQIRLIQKNEMSVNDQIYAECKQE